jgi:hypothetical protein
MVLGSLEIGLKAPISNRFFNIEAILDGSIVLPSDLATRCASGRVIVIHLRN